MPGGPPKAEPGDGRAALIYERLNPAVQQQALARLCRPLSKAKYAATIKSLTESLTGGSCHCLLPGTARPGKNGLAGT